MKISTTDLKEVIVVEPRVFEDSRGYFMETYNRRRYGDADIRSDFCQDNMSFSHRGVLRGLHFQHPHAQAKLVQVLQGEIYDVVVDIRVGSPTFGCWVGMVLSASDRKQVFIPEGFAHGFCVLSATASFVYKCSADYAPDCEGGIIWSDPDLGIDWPLAEPLLSEKDAAFPRLKDLSAKALPVYSGPAVQMRSGKR